MVNWLVKNFTHWSCWPVMSCWDSHFVHSWINNQVLNYKSYFYHDQSHTKTYTNRYLFKQLKFFRLVFVMRSRLIGMPFEQLGLSISRKYSAVQTTAATMYHIHSKKVLICYKGRDFHFTIQAFQTAEVFCIAKEIKFQPWWRFSL